MLLRPRNRASQAPSEPATLKKQVKLLPMQQDKSETESIVLLSKKIMKRYIVYQDEEVGFPNTYRDAAHETPTADEDYDSQDEIVTYGVEKCLRLLQKRVTQLSKEEENVPETDSEFESVLTANKPAEISAYDPKEGDDFK